MLRKSTKTERPQISTMPRQQSEATAHLQIYKLLVEKNRLQQELQTLDQRRQQIVRQLSTLEQQVTDLETTADRLQSANPTQPLPPAPQASSDSFDTLILEY